MLGSIAEEDPPDYMVVWDTIKPFSKGEMGHITQSYLVKQLCGQNSCMKEILSKWVKTAS